MSTLIILYRSIDNIFPSFTWAILFVPLLNLFLINKPQSLKLLVTLKINKQYQFCRKSS